MFFMDMIFKRIINNLYIYSFLFYKEKGYSYNRLHVIKFAIYTSVLRIWRLQNKVLIPVNFHSAMINTK